VHCWKWYGQQKIDLVEIRDEHRSRSVEQTWVAGGIEVVCFSLDHVSENSFEF
jgi:hypothetical protein